MRHHSSFFLDTVDGWTAKYAGKQCRIYTGGVNATKGQAPLGTVLAEFVIPAPGHSSAIVNSGSAVATITNSWGDPSANATGNPGCFAVFDGTSVIVDGSCGTSGADMIISAATLNVGSPFTIDSWTISQPIT